MSTGCVWLRNPRTTNKKRLYSTTRWLEKLEGPSPVPVQEPTAGFNGKR